MRMNTEASKTMLDYAIAETSITSAIPFRMGRDTSGLERGGRRHEAAFESPLAAALDLLRISVILTDRSAEILYANCQAKALLREQRWLRLCTGKLSAANPKCALQLRQAIHRCTRGEANPALRLGIAVPLLRADERSIAGWVLPIQQTRCEDVQQAAIFIRRAADLSSEEMFASTFGATSAYASRAALTTVPADQKG